MTTAEWDRLNPGIPMPCGLRDPWTWHQPKDRAELLQRLAEARDLNVNERERENLCSVAHGEIQMLAQDNANLHELLSQAMALINEIQEKVDAVAKHGDPRRGQQAREAA